MFASSAFLLLSLAAPPVAEPDRRDRQNPELVVEAGGRTATCDAIAFSPDGKTLFAGGDDKVVRVWPVTAEGLTANAMRTLRWPAWREYRGGIKTLAVSPDGKRIVVGGFGTRASGGSICVMTWPKGDIENLYVPARADGRSSYTVMSARFSPDSNTVAFGTADGAIWIWEYATVKPARELGGHEPIRPASGGPAEFNRPRLLTFPEPGKLVSLAESGEVLAFDLTAKPPTRTVLFDITKTEGFMPKTPARVFQATVSPDGKWFAAGREVSEPALILRTLDGTKSRVLPLEPGKYVNALAFNPTGDKLAVAIGSWRPIAETRGFVLEANDQLVVIDHPLTAEKLVTRPGPPHRFRAEALAFHPDGRLAVAGGDNHEVTLWNLAKPDSVPSVARGAGRNLWGVRVSTNGEVIGFQPRRNPDSNDPNARGTGPWVAFDLARTKHTADAQTWVEPVLTSPDGWTVEATDRQFRWRVMNAKLGAAHDLPWDKDRDESPRCYTFLPPVKVGGLTRLAVGHMYGFSVFELSAKTPPVRTVWAKGHSSEVMALAPAKDGTWLVSTGTDQTVAGWNLGGTPSGNALGATLAVKAGKLVVTQIDVGGPAWEMGLVNGAEILGVGLREATVSSVPYSVGLPDEGLPAKGTPEVGLAKLNAVMPAASLFLVWKEPGRDRVSRGQTTLPTRPLWRFFPAFDGDDKISDWVTWIWTTGHYHTSTNGDFLIGWHVNRPDETKTPEFYPAERFREMYHREGVVRRFLQSRDLPEALTDLLGKNPMPIRFNDHEPEAVAVAVTPLTDLGSTAKVSVPTSGTNPDLWPDSVEVWVNDYRVIRLASEGRALREREVVIPNHVLRAGKNTITALTMNRLGGRAETQLVVEKEIAPRPPRLFGLAIGINDYTRSRLGPASAKPVGPDVRPETQFGPEVPFVTRAGGGIAFGNLAGARNDATKMRERWMDQAGAGRMYTTGDFLMVLDPKAGRSEILSALDQIGREATADDRFVLFLAGHGDYVTIPRKDRAARKEFVFCSQDYDRSRPTETGLRASELIDRLGELPCRKVVLLDACHSGQVASTNLVRDLVPHGQGPVIFAACDQSEFSYELKSRGHGVFSFAVLEALGPEMPADRNGDGRLDVGELTTYVNKRTPVLLRELNAKLTGDEQTPQRFPRQPEPFSVASKR